MKKKPKGTTIFNILVIAFSLGMLAYFGFSEDGLVDLFKNIDYFQVEWLLVGAGFMLLNFLVDIWLTQIFVRISYPKYRFLSATRVSMAGQFYNNVTPYGVAGKPMQIVLMKTHADCPHEPPGGRRGPRQLRDDAEIPCLSDNAFLIFPYCHPISLSFFSRADQRYDVSDNYSFCISLVYYIIYFNILLY